MLTTDITKLRSPFNPANTISSFCLAVQLRYFLCSLNPISLSVERPMLSPTPDSLSGGYAPSEPARPKSANRQHATGERSRPSAQVSTKAGAFHRESTVLVFGGVTSGVVGVVTVCAAG